ncbi:MAG: tRNA 2-thiocytidine biosynthesis protein TtcA [Bacteroidales bacterium]|nr:tRNA 2-thiocytidine biosynthesis protein TtcA [Bacteroidales bacterium]
MKPVYNKNYGKWFVNDVLKAISRYRMIDSGEKISVALSGGKDSITLLYILKYINDFSHLKFELSAIHVKTFSDYNTDILKEYCNQLEIPYFETILESEKEVPKKSICYLCSRLKRGAISSILKEKGIKKVCFGHHANDVAETLLMNMIENKKLGSFSPRVEISENEPIILRPMVYLEEAIINSLHKNHNLPLLEEVCMYGYCNNRSKYKKLILQMEEAIEQKSISASITKSLENLDYTNIWRQS